MYQNVNLVIDSNYINKIPFSSNILDFVFMIARLEILSN